MELTELGWDPDFDSRFESHRNDGLVPARVAREEKLLYGLLAERGELDGQVSGRFSHNARSRADFPAIGDWVAVEPHPAGAAATIRAVLPRRSAFGRGMAGGETDEQIVAANVDTVFVMTGLDGEFNLRRLERYVVAGRSSGAQPVILLNKADVCPDAGACVADVEALAPGAPVHAVSAVSGLGLEGLAPYLRPGRTVAVIGSSGVGKSTLINALLGEERLAVAAVRASDGHGRHTTTRRELIPLPCGALVIDTPGMRELRLWADADEADAAFTDVREAAGRCRFRDCRHQAEPGCAVRRAIEEGTLDYARYDSYLKLQRETRSFERRQVAKQRMRDRGAHREAEQKEERRAQTERQGRRRDAERGLW